MIDKSNWIFVSQESKKPFTKKYKVHEDGIDYVVWEKKCGTVIYTHKGKRHRINDKPAVLYKCGSKAWYINGKSIRYGNKPSLECTHKYWQRGLKFTFTNTEGFVHRIDGPAMVYFNSIRNRYYFNKKEYSQEEYSVLPERKIELTRQRLKNKNI